LMTLAAPSSTSPPQINATVSVASARGGGTGGTGTPEPTSLTLGCLASCGWGLGAWLRRRRVGTAPDEVG
jgi:hypothetical protein